MAEQPPVSAESPFTGRSFDRIAAGYDRANAAMTFGRNSAWLRNAARVALEGCPSPACGLDVATGTGAFAIELARLAPDAVICGLDISRPMVDVASARVERHGPGGTIQLLLGEALKLPFPDGTFDFAVSAYLLRNVGDLPAAFAEMARVTRPGGRVVAMDITPAHGPGPLERIARWYLRTVAPLMGGLLTGDSDAYRYLPASVSAFVPAEEVAGVMDNCGLVDVGFRRFALGTMALHWGRVPAPAGRGSEEAPSRRRCASGRRQTK